HLVLARTGDDVGAIPDGTCVGVVLVLVADGEQIGLEPRQLRPQGRRVRVADDGRGLSSQSETAVTHPGDVQNRSPLPAHEGEARPAPAPVHWAYILSGALTPIRPSAMRSVLRAARHSSSRARVSSGSGTTTRFAGWSFPAW